MEIFLQERELANDIGACGSAWGVLYGAVKREAGIAVEALDGIPDTVAVRGRNLQIQVKVAYIGVERETAAAVPVGAYARYLVASCSDT